MRRNFRRHAYRDSVGAVDQQIRNARGKDVGLDFATVVVGVEVDGVFVDIFEQRRGNLRKLGFGVTVGRRRISVNRAEISLAENQRITHRPGLRQANQSVIHGEIAVWMVLAHDFADDAGAFARRPVGVQPHLLHCVKYSAMDWF